ncbi:AraC family transcriptional regulator [Curtobacterium sp. VKM Ac-1376]|uniref:AraC family transcriptional regulator n=1 Tax=Curtobacterium sp. VKM Ac-1376 TaxID=123312 RepID=UPI001E3F752A|nr:AraC family transcriptional regulator [Curtobacterium sp. VKM Ac-1376]
MIHRVQRETQTHEPSVAAEAMARTHITHGLSVEPTGSEFVFEERVRGSDLLALESTRSTAVVTGVMEPGSAMMILWMKSGSGHLDDNPLKIGRPVLFRQGPQRFRWIDCTKDVLRIDRAIVEQVAAERGDWAPGPLEFRPRHVPEGPTLAAWWLMVRSVAEEVLRGPDEVPVERERELARFAAGGLLTAIPHWPVGQHEPPVVAATARFARAEAFLLDHATEQITVEDVAEAAGLSVRGVQAAFQRHHGITPTMYLRRIRLLLAREQLEAGDGRSVAEIARATGFAHLGRFAGSYRQEFGELPRQTASTAREDSRV